MLVSSGVTIEGGKQHLIEIGNKSHPNLFSRDVLDLFFEKTGAHPHVRVGGTSG